MIDEDGYVKITGRLKDIIIRGGENIHPYDLGVVIMIEATRLILT